MNDFNVIWIRRKKGINTDLLLISYLYSMSVYSQVAVIAA